jgi:hypothetical protein
MDTLAKADIFFFVATISVIVITIILVIVGIYVVKILKDMRKMSQKIKMLGIFIKKLIQR